MPLASLDSLHSILACPCCKAPLVEAMPSFRCSSEDCRYNADGSFLSLGSKPVLVDFDRSILDAVELALDVEQKPTVRQAARKLAQRIIVGKSDNPTARRNARVFIDSLPARGRVLVVGGAVTGNGADELYSDPRVSLVSFDIASSVLTQFVADAHDIPLLPGSVDGVWIQAVLEHVLDPWRVADEIHRVLSAGGIVYADTPFMQPVHAGPWDFTRFTESGHRWLFRRFERIDSGVVSGSGSALASAVDYAVRAVVRSNAVGRIIRRIFWPVAAAIDKFGGHSHAVDAASAVFFLGRRVEGSLSPRDMVGEYRGSQRGNVHDRR